MKVPINPRSLEIAEQEKIKKEARLKKSALYELAETVKAEAGTGKAKAAPSLLTKAGKFAAK